MHKFWNLVHKMDCFIYGMVKTLTDSDFYWSLFQPIQIVHCGHIIKDEDAHLLHDDPYKLQCGHCGTFLYTEPKVPQDDTQ